MSTSGAAQACTDLGAVERLFAMRLAPTPTRDAMPELCDLRALAALSRSDVARLIDVVASSSESAARDELALVGVQSLDIASALVLLKLREK